MQIQTLVGNQQNHTRYLEFKRVLKEELSKTLVEVEVPSMTPEVIQEQFSYYFETNLNFAGQSKMLFLQPHPELYVKHLLLHGFPSLFTVAKSFRNNEDSTRLHFPEFEMLEIYIRDISYLELADFTLKIFKNTLKKMTGSTEFLVNGRKMSLKKLQKIKIKEAFKKYAGVEWVMDGEKFLEECKSLGYKTTGFTPIELFSQIYTDKVEPHLGVGECPEIIYDFPEYMRATSFVEEEGDVLITKRWEMYINGVELANGAREGVLNVKNTQEKLEFKKFFEGCKVSGLGLGLERFFMVLFGFEKLEELKVVQYK